MIISKFLKNKVFEYNTDLRWLLIKDHNVNYEPRKIALTRTEMFSLMRFCIRVTQKGKPRK